MTHLSKLIVAVALLALSGVASADKVDTFESMSSEDRCEVKANLFIQGIRAFSLDRTLEEHILIKHRGTPNDDELALMLKYMAMGERVALKEFGLQSGEVTRGWAIAAGQGFNRVCLIDESRPGVRI